MAEYKLVKDVFIGGEVKSAGEVIDLTADEAKPFVERGSIVAFDPDATDVVVKPKLEGETTDEFIYGDVSYKQITNADGVFYVVNDEEVSEESYRAAMHEAVKQQLQERADDVVNTQVTDTQEAGQTDDPLGTTVQDGPQSPLDQSQGSQSSNTQSQPPSSETPSTNLHLG